jgi:hypothetical protein
VTDHLEAVGAPVVGNARELPAGPHEHDGLAMTFTAWAPPGPDRIPDVADCLADAFGDDPEWDGYIRNFVRLIEES